MVRPTRAFFSGPRHLAAARFALAALAPFGACALPPVAAAQAPAIDSLTAERLVWSTLVALDQANTTGNYSVLRDIAAPAFQANNSPATLAGTFQALRAQNIDLSYCLVTTPTFQFPPSIVQGGLLRLRGSFPLRPTAIAFDMLFTNAGGQWRLFGLAVVPLVPQPAPAPAAPARNVPLRR